MNIFLCRHTQVHNPQKVVYRRLPGYYLSDQGKLQAKKTGEFLKKENIEEIFTSPMERCVQVSEVIKETIANPKIRIYQKEYLNEWGEGERTADIAKRMNFILRGKKNNRVYVSHKDPIRVFLNSVTGRPLRDIDYWDCPHGAVYKIKINKKILPELVFHPNKSN